MSEINGAKTLKEEAKLLKENQELELDKIHAKGQEIIEDATKSGEKIKDNIISEAKKQASEILVKAEKEASKEKVKAMEELKVQSIDMAVMIASKILEEQLVLNEEKQHSLIEKFVDEVGALDW